MKEWYQNATVEQNDQQRLKIIIVFMLCLCFSQFTAVICTENVLAVFLQHKCWDTLEI